MRVWFCLQGEWGSDESIAPPSAPVSTPTKCALVSVPPQALTPIAVSASVTSRVVKRTRSAEKNDNPSSAKRAKKEKKEKEEEEMHKKEMKALKEEKRENKALKKVNKALKVLQTNVIATDLRSIDAS